MGDVGTWFQQSRHHCKLGYPSVEMLSPSKNADGPQGHLSIVYISWSIKEMRSRFLKHLTISPVEEERGVNGPCELTLTMLDP